MIMTIAQFSDIFDIYLHLGLRMITLLLVACFVAWYLIVKWRKRHVTRLAEQLKSSMMSLPLIGHMYLLLGSTEDLMKTMRRGSRDAMQCGGTVTHWYAHKRYITVVDPEVADFILKNCLEKDVCFDFFQDVFGDGSFSTTVKKWRPRRKLLAPTFSMKKLNRFVEVFATQSSFLAKKLEEIAGQGPFPMWKLISGYSMDAICETTMGVQAKAQETDHPNIPALNNLFHMVVQRACKPWLHSDFIYKKSNLHRVFTKSKALVDTFIDDIIKHKRANHDNFESPSKENKPDRLKPFVELVLESEGGETDVAIHEECLVLLAAGTDTSAVGLGYALVLLATYPEVQEKAYQELKEIFSDPSKPVQADDLRHLKYLDAVCRETLRLYPPVPLILRKIEKDINLPTGVVAPAGCGAIISIWGIHHNPAIWGHDVEEFHPERFLDSTPRHTAAFIPFSCGPRNCVGYQYAMMSMKTVLCNVLRKFRLVPASEVRQPLRLEFNIMMRDVDQYQVGIEMRQ